MKAIFFEKHGDINVLKYGELPDPKPKQGEVLIQVEAAALNHLDIWVRRGWPGLVLNIPHITGSDIVGKVVELNGSSSFTAGDRVMVYPGVNTTCDEWVQRGEQSVSPGYQIIGEDLPGGLAEYVTVPIDNICKPLERRSPVESAAGILVGLTTYRMLFSRCDLQPQQQVLIVGSGGGVNSLAIQFCKAVGAKTIAIAGGEKKVERAAALGADEVIDYKKTDKWQKEVLKITSGRGVHLAIDNVGTVTFSKTIQAVAPGGKIAVVGNTSGPKVELDMRYLFAKQLSIIGSTMGSRKEFEKSGQFMTKHDIVPVIDTVAPLSSGIEMISRLESGEHFGKIVIESNL